MITEKKKQKNCFDYFILLSDVNNRKPNSNIYNAIPLNVLINMSPVVSKYIFSIYGNVIQRIHGTHRFRLNVVHVVTNESTAIKKWDNISKFGLLTKQLVRMYYMMFVNENYVNHSTKPNTEFLLILRGFHWKSFRYRYLLYIQYQIW